MSGHLVHIDANGYTLLGRLYGNKNSRRLLPGVLFLRGWSPRLPWTYMDLHARQCARELGIVCLSVQYRGMGSPGNANKLTRSDFLNDAIASYDFLVSQEGVDSKRIFAVGESLGAYMAALLSEKRDIIGLLLRAPADFPDEGFADEADLRRVIKRTQEWREQAHDPSESMALGAAGRFSGDILAVASERDSKVPRQTADNYLSAAGKAKFILMEDAGHALISPLKQKEFHRIVIGWLKKLI